MAKRKTTRKSKAKTAGASAAKKSTSSSASSTSGTGADRAVADALKGAKLLTQRQIDRAAREVKQAGGSLRDVLMSEVGDDKLRRSLDKEVMYGGARRPLEDVLLEAEWLDEAEVERLAGAPADEEDRILGSMLVRQGVISQDQLQQAQIIQQTTGHKLWRTLLNMGVVAPKAIGDMTRGEATMPLTAAAEERLGQIMVEKGMITEAEIADALNTRQTTGQALSDVLIEKGLLNEAQLALALGQQHNVPFLDLGKVQIQPDAIGLLPRVTIVESQALPVKLDGKKLTVAFADPALASKLDSSAIVLGLTIEPAVSPRSQVAAAIKEYVGEVAARPVEPADVQVGGVVNIAGEMEELTKTASPTELVDRIVAEGIKARATDIHFDPDRDGGLRVRYRIDSLLHDVMNLPESFGAPVISRLKILANMNIIEKRAAQDGHISRPDGDRTQEIRVATVPTAMGEKMVLRLIDETQVLTGLTQLGLEPEQIESLNGLIEKPYGMLLAVGPVGSGKTTTLYASLNQVNVLTKNVMTIEDPVEYSVRGVNQLQVNYATDFTFAKGLRAILRQDPDTIMVGEIRDDETAQIAIRAAMTGVLVFSTMHANDAPSTIGSLYNHGIPGFLISSAMVGVIAQRLVRKICPDCKVEYEPDASVFRQLRIRDEDVERVDGKLFRGIGCASCFHTGYLGRTGVFEIMEMSEEIRDLIFRQTTKEVIRTVAVDLGMQTLAESTKNKVLAGITTAEEMFRLIYV